MMVGKYFGTDGIRGKVGEQPITAEFMLKLGWAVGNVLAGKTGGSVLIGKDTRLSGYMFESALEAGLSAAGIDIKLLGPIPTPGIAYLTRTLHAEAGIVISASHNPYYDNGVKFFTGMGAKLATEVERSIEAKLDENMRTVNPENIGKAQRMDDAAGRYIEFCKSSVSMNLNLKGLKVVVDCAHGATYHIAPHVFEEKGAEIIVIGGKPDGLNINDQVGSTHPKLLQSKVLEHGADIGIAFDGDGDRVIMVDHKGEIVDGDEILFIIARSRHKSGCLGGGVVGTSMSNLGLEMALNELGVAFNRSDVGDRYVMEMLKQKSWHLGGETSGHIICLDRTTTGDGVISALQVLEVMQQSENSLFELKSAMSKYPQRLVNVRLDKKVNVVESGEMQKAVLEVERELAGKGRVLLRESGTEPVIRVMVEGKDALLVNKLVDQLADKVKELSTN
jgi:phosphoglucosamine mutase